MSSYILEYDFYSNIKVFSIFMFYFYIGNENMTLIIISYAKLQDPLLFKFTEMPFILI